MTDPSQYFKGRTVQEQMNEVIGYVDVRSAEVATDAIASDVAQVHRDMLDADADAAAAAASAAAAAGTLANAVKKTGEASQSIDGDIDLNDDLNVDGDATVGGALAVTGAVTVPTPVNNTDAATKKYVDDADALKLNITDVNSYAVGLTDNQGPIAGIKQFAKPPAIAMHESGSNNTNGWRKIFVSPSFATANDNNACIFHLIANTGHYGLFMMFARNSTLNNLVKLCGNFQIANVKASIAADGEVTIWAFNYRSVGIMVSEVHNGNNTTTFADSGTTTIFNEPTTPDYAQVITATE